MAPKRKYAGEKTAPPADGRSKGVPGAVSDAGRTRGSVFAQSLIKAQANFSAEKITVSLDEKKVMKLEEKLEGEVPPVVEPEPELEPVVEVESETKPVVEVESKPKPVVEVESKPKPVVEIESEPLVELEPLVEPEPEAKKAKKKAKRAKKKAKKVAPADDQPEGKPGSDKDRDVPPRSGWCTIL